MAYLSLKDYGIIGNQQSAALVSRYGSIDWCCFPYLDSPSHFGALLDENRGGSFRVAPQGDFYSEQRYLQRTNIIETRFETATGRAVLTDWMPADPGSLGEPVIHRRVDGVDGHIEITMSCVPKFDYATETAQAERFENGVLFRGSLAGDIAYLHSNIPLTIPGNGAGATAKFTLNPGEQAYFSWAWGRRRLVAEIPSPLITAEYWRSKAHRCEEESSMGCLFAGPWHDVVTRSSLVLQLMTSSFGGATAESATTSLPVLQGGSRNWDYRYAWLRNSAFTLQAFHHLGYRNEAARLFNWISDRVLRDGAENLQCVYTLDGGRNLTERELSYLGGYSGARPVRVGNMSARQFHLDVFGHVMLAASQQLSITGVFPREVWPRMVEIADYVCHAWRRPDRGPWESRGKPEHFVVSKILCWVTLDRATWIAKTLGEPVPARWLRELGILHRTICEQGFDDQKRSFVRAFGERELDSATLLIPLLGFLPVDDERVLGTLDAVMTELSEGALLHRYSSSDRLPESDGAHMVSSFWLVCCLALSGRVDEASDRLAELCTYATPLGLFGEQIDGGSGDPAGNFPSTASHLALVNAGIYVGAMRGSRHELLSVMGLPAIMPTAA